MKRKTFSLLCPGGDGGLASFQEVDGKWIEVLPGMMTFIWSDEDEDVYGLDGPFDVFHLVEGRSGVCIGRGLDEAEAIESAEVMNRSRGRDGLSIMIRNAIERYGISPAFRKEEGS